MTFSSVYAPDAPRLVDFKSVRPAYQASQSEALEWLAELHAEAERARAPDPAAFDADAFRERLRKLLYRYGCSPEKIAVRGYEIADGNHRAWSDMRIYDVARRPEGAGSRLRTETYALAAEAAVDRLYPAPEVAPRDLLHVTCTGYASPSVAQKLVAKRGWGAETRVTHAYHMGCYASLPAVRIARGFLASAPAAPDGRAYRADIVHNEVCTLHLRPADHSPEQLVVQSLFADGHIRYSVVSEEEGRKAHPGASLALLGAREEILPDSAEAMAWMASDHGMYMTLSREVPSRIASAAREFVAALFAGAGLDFGRHASRTVFAVHPGGPKVIDVVQQTLELADAQVAASRRVLLGYGNMSSATLPHIWMDLVGDGSVPVDTPVASLAFGPGLTVSGAIMVKR